MSDNGQIINIGTEQINLMELEKAVLTSQNKNIAPLGIAKYVYDLPTGKDVETLIEEIKNSTSELLSTKTLVLEASYEGQFIFPLTYPIENYDLEHFPMIILRVINGKIAQVGTDEYIINEKGDTDDQLIFNTAKQPAFYKGETCIVIFHYSNTLHTNATVNAETVNNTMVIFGQPEDGLDYPDNTVIFDLANGYIYYYKDGEKKKIKLGANKIETYTKTIKENTQTVQIDAPGYNTAEDDLLIYENSVLIDRDLYYTVDENLIMRKVGNIIWEANEEAPITFTFVIYKNTMVQSAGTNNSSVVIVPDNSVNEDKLSPELKTYIQQISEAAKKLEQGNDKIYNCGTTTGVNAYKVETDKIKEYNNELTIRVIIGDQNTGASTLAINDLAALDVLDSFGNQVPAGFFKKGIPYILSCNGSNFIVSGKGGGGTATPDKVLIDETFTSNNGLQKGTMPSINVPTTNLNCGNSFTIAKGYHPGTEKVIANSLASQLSNSTLTNANQLVSGVKAYDKNGNLIIGNAEKIDESGIEIGALRFRTAVKLNISEKLTLNNTIDFAYVMPVARNNTICVVENGTIVPGVKVDDYVFSLSDDKKTLISTPTKEYNNAGTNQRIVAIAIHYKS